MLFNPTVNGSAIQHSQRHLGVWDCVIEAAMRKRLSMLRNSQVLILAALLLSFPGGAVATATGWVSVLLAAFWGSIPMLLVVLVCMKFLLVPDGLGITYELHYNASPMPGALALVVGVLVALVAFILASGSLIGLMQGPRQQFRILFMGGYIVVVSAAVFLLLGIQHTSRKLTSPVPGLPTRLAAEGVEPRGPGSASGDLQRSFDFAADDDVDPLKRPDAPPTTAT